MIPETLTFKPEALTSLCSVCINENSGAKIALTIIISALILLAIGNWAWKKYFANKREISQEK